MSEPVSLDRYRETRITPSLSIKANPAISEPMGQPEAKGIPTSVALTVGGGLCAIVLALVGIIYSSVAGDVTDLKKDVKEIRSDIGGLRGDVREIRTDLAGIAKQGAETNVRLQALIDETRRRPR